MPNPHLLVIDDEECIRRMLQRTLRRHFEVQVVASAELALDIIDRGTVFDVFLCDLNLPTLSGQDFLEELQHRSLDIAARLVIITGAPPPDNDSFARIMGERYLVKPCSVEVLIATLTRLAYPRMSAPPVAPLAAA